MAMVTRGCYHFLNLTLLPLSKAFLPAHSEPLVLPELLISQT